MNIYSKLALLEKENHPFVLVTVVDSSGSVPGKIGFKMIVESSGTTFGTVGGGAIEFEAISHAKSVLGNQLGEIKKYVLSNENVDVREDEQLLSMRCNGKVSLFYEPHGNQPNAYVFGGGHVGQALCPVLSKLGYRITLIENREEYACEVKCPGADKYVCSDYINFCEITDFDQDSFAVILTHGHSFDYEILKILYGKNAKPQYIGAIASKAKASLFKHQLKEEYGENIDLGNLRSPIGLDIGGNTADEIAISIASEMQSVRYKKS